VIAPACGLPNILSEATRAFLDVLDRYTLADVLSRRADLRGLFGGFQPLKKTIKQVVENTDLETSDS
jgi:Rrf2 family nitric oxide-sensitive transcriptional repressor